MKCSYVKCKILLKHRQSFFTCLPK